MHRYLPLLLIVGLITAFRIVGILLPESLPNFQPLAALFFCGALLAPGWRGIAIPFGIWAVTYPFGIGPIYNVPIFLTTLLALVTVFFMGTAISKRGAPSLLFGSVAAALVFHLITNGCAWLSDTMYEKSLTGLEQSLWSGAPGSSLPSWIFLRNMAAANFLFTGIFAGIQFRLPQPAATVTCALHAK